MDPGQTQVTSLTLSNLYEHAQLVALNTSYIQSLGPDPVNLNTKNPYSLADYVSIVLNPDILIEGMYTLDFQLSAVVQEEELLVASDVIRVQRVYVP